MGKGRSPIMQGKVPKGRTRQPTYGWQMVQSCFMLVPGRRALQRSSLDALVRFHQPVFRQHVNGIRAADQLDASCTKQGCVESVGAAICAFLFEMNLVIILPGERAKSPNQMCVVFVQQFIFQRQEGHPWMPTVGPFLVACVGVCRALTLLDYLIKYSHESLIPRICCHATCQGTDRAAGWRSRPSHGPTPILLQV